MEFFIAKNSTLPLLKMQVVQDGRSDFQNFSDLISTSKILFSMNDVYTGRPKISSKRAGFVHKTFVNPDTPVEYYIYYQFTKRDTNTVGRYEGQFLFSNEQGVLILPLRERLFINVQDSFVQENFCC
jgi:hypothetical protein